MHTILWHSIIIAFSSVKTWVLACWWRRFDWSFARLIAPVVTTTAIDLSSNKIQNGDTLVPAYPGCPGNWPLNECYLTVPVIYRTEARILSNDKLKGSRVPELEHWGLDHPNFAMDRSTLLDHSSNVNGKTCRCRWMCRCALQGVSPPVARTSEDFDAGSKYHVPGNTPYIRYDRKCREHRTTSIRMIFFLCHPPLPVVLIYRTMFSIIALFTAVTTKTKVKLLQYNDSLT